MLKPRYPIKTDRLDLRPMESGDLNDLFAFHSHPDVVRYLYWEPRSREQTRVYIAEKSSVRTWEKEGDGIALAAVLRETGSVVGQVSLIWLSREHRQGEIGFIVHPRYQGRGLAREAAEAILRLGFEEAGLHRIIGRCDALNLASAMLMERLGMRREAHFVESEIFKGSWGSEYVYAMLASEWASH